MVYLATAPPQMPQRTGELKHHRTFLGHNIFMLMWSCLETYGL